MRTTTTVETITCDRCGVSADTSKGTGYGQPFACSAQVVVTATVRNSLSDAAGYGKRYDLCGACLESFDAWKEGGKSEQVKT